MTFAVDINEARTQFPAYTVLPPLELEFAAGWVSLT